MLTEGLDGYTGSNGDMLLGTCERHMVQFFAILARMPRHYNVGIRQITLFNRLHPNVTQVLQQTTVDKNIRRGFQELR